MTAILSGGMDELASAYAVAGAQSYWSFMVALARMAATRCVRGRLDPRVRVVDGFGR